MGKKKIPRQTSGIGSQDTTKILKELKFDINHPLKDTLKSVFDEGGKMTLSFPSASRFQVSIAKIILN